MQVLPWNKSRRHRPLRHAAMGILSLGTILIGWGGGGIFAAENTPATFVPLTQRVQTDVHCLTRIPLETSIGLPSTAAIRSVYGTIHHWVITGTANAHG